MKPTVKNLNTNMTLRELLELTKPSSLFLPPVQLKKMKLIAAYSTPTLRIRVYANGLVLAADGIREAVIPVSTDNTYDFDPVRTADNKHRKLCGKPRDLQSDFDSPFFLDEPWTVKVVLVAMDELSRLSDIDNRVAALQTDTLTYTDCFEGELIERMDRDALLEKLTALLTDREKRILHMRFNEIMTLDAVADILGVSRERVRQLETKALNKLRNYVKRMREKVAEEGDRGNG